MAPPTRLNNRPTVFLTTTDSNADGGNDWQRRCAIETACPSFERELTAERDKNLRLAAEFDNFRKRMIKERLEAESRGQVELVKQIIDPLDDIARFAHVDPAVTDSSTVVQGVEMVEKKLGKSLRSAGLESVNPVGEPFDPAFHEAVGTESPRHLNSRITLCPAFIRPVTRSRDSFCGRPG